METNEVSLHQIKVYLAVRDCKRWITAKEVAEIACVAPRTARAHALKLVNLGIFDQAEVFPAHRYHISETADKRNKGYTLRLEQAMKVFGVS